MREGVAELLQRLGVDPAGVESHELPHNQWLSAAVWAIRSGSDRQGVLKVTRADRSRGTTAWEAHWSADDHDPERWTYWRREALAYRDGLPDEYTGSGIAAPVCIAADVDDREALLLLEWVDGDAGESWPVGSYARAANALGRAQAPFLTGRPLPAVPYLTKGFLRDYSSEKPVDWNLLDDDSVWQHPVVRATFPAGLREAAKFVHANRARLYAINESLPQTLCHLDFWPKNLFGRSTGRITLIDWGFVGRGAVGEDVGNVVPDSAFDFFLDADDLPQLERVVFDGYVRGLRHGGWREDPRLVQLGMWSSSVKYDWLTPFTLGQVDQARQYRYGGGGEVDPTMKFRARSRVLLFNAQWARQAIELADQLGV
jgi:hypothetical protein